MKFNKSHFEDYLSERLPTTERNDFEQSLKENEELRSSFDFYKNFRQKNGASIATKESSTTVPVQNTTSNSRTFNFLSMVYGISLLAAIGFLGFSAVYWHALYNYTNDALKEEFLFEAYDVDALEEGLVEAGSSIIHLQEVVLAQQYFKSRELIDAVNFLDQIIDNNTQTSNLFGTDLSTKLLEQTEWNRVIALLLLEDHESEEDVLFALDGMIDDPSHSYHKKAVALDAKMKSFMRGLVASI